MNNNKADYGIDAPNVVRNLFLFAFALLILSIFVFQIQNTYLLWIILFYSLPVGLILLILGCWMLYGIKIAKPTIASELIQNLGLTGNEKLLDLGCGRGLLLCEAAKHLPEGEAHGIDLWSHKDQSGNKLETTLENAEREGVKQRVIVHTGDIRALPFPDGSFDVAVSCLCLHNISEKNERDKALLEMLRVLKAGGKFAIADIQCVKEYAEFLMEKGVDVSYSKPNYAYCPPIRTIEGTKP